jgi:hypothetical protein
MLERLRANGLNMVATTLEVRSGEGGEFKAEGSSDSYIVTLDSDYRPKQIQFESTGLNSGFRVLYSDYASQGKTFYPKTTQVIEPGTIHRGIVMTLEKIELNPPTVKDGDFVPKKKGGGLPGFK